jgi:hypothetical protein
MIKLKPVMAAEVMGETAMFPVIVELGTVEIAAFARMANSPAAFPSGTGGTLLGVPLTALTMTITESKKRFKFIMLDLDVGLMEVVLVFFCSVYIFVRLIYVFDFCVNALV